MLEPLRVALYGALLVLAFGAGWALSPKPRPLPPPACVTTQPPVETVNITVQTDPPGATMVFPDGAKRRTPVTFNEPRGDEAVNVRLYREGFFTKGLVIRPDLDRSYLIMLERNHEPDCDDKLLVPSF
jgi:hypothetical protein